MDLIKTSQMLSKRYQAEQSRGHCNHNQDTVIKYIPMEQPFIACFISTTMKHGRMLAFIRQYIVSN